jgi:hypothetical protein
MEDNRGGGCLAIAVLVVLVLVSFFRILDLEERIKQLEASAPSASREPE